MKSIDKKAFEPIDQEEKKLLESIERGEWRSVKNLKEEKEKARKAAQNTLREKQSLKISLSREDYENIKSRANKEGLSSQALISRLVHNYLNGSLVNKE